MQPSTIMHAVLLVRKLIVGPNLDIRLSEQKNVGSELKTEFHIMGIH
jgi:hypothetical protein